jgi:hypothetical protein
VARIALLSPDLLFGSRVEGALRAAGHEVAPVGEVADALGADALVVDLRDAVPSLAGLEGVPALAVYSHVDQEMRRRAEEAGFDRVVPRSRMAREGPALVEALL